MTSEPKFEIWKSTTDGQTKFLEDCFEVEEAVRGRAEWQINFPDDFVWVQDKDSGKVVVGYV